MSALSKKKVIAITGSMGSGKSKVSSLIREKYPVIDCDEINRELIKKGNEGYNQLILLKYIQLDKLGYIDKTHMANQVFKNPVYKKEVESILHPLIFQKVDEWVCTQNVPVVFVEVPILFECNRQNQFDEVWCVVCCQQIALDRLQKGRNISKEQALMRLHNQLDPSIKARQSDVVIENDGSLEELKCKVYGELRKGEKRWN